MENATKGAAEAAAPEQNPGTDSKAPEASTPKADKKTKGAAEAAAPEVSLTKDYEVLDNIWWKGKNQLKGTTLALTSEEYKKISQYVSPILK